MKLFIRSLFVILPIGILVFLLVQMVIANQMIVLGDRLNRTEKRIAQMEEQNEYLQRTVTTLSSIQRVQTQAKLMGFKEPAAVMAYDHGLLPVALKR